MVCSSSWGHPNSDAQMRNKQQAYANLKLHGEKLNLAMPVEANNKHIQPGMGTSK